MSVSSLDLGPSASQVTSSLATNVQAQMSNINMSQFAPFLGMSAKDAPTSLKDVVKDIVKEIVVDELANSFGFSSPPNCQLRSSPVPHLPPTIHHSL